MQAPKYRYNEQVVLVGNGYHCKIVKVIKHNGRYLYKIVVNGSSVKPFVVEEDRIVANWLVK